MRSRYFLQAKIYLLLLKTLLNLEAYASVNLFYPLIRVGAMRGLCLYNRLLELHTQQKERKVALVKKQDEFNMRSRCLGILCRKEILFFVSSCTFRKRTR
jgi:hypothetical protein